MSSSSVTLFSTPLSLVSIPLDIYPLFYHGVSKLLLQTWKQDFLDKQRENSPVSSEESPVLAHYQSKRRSRIEDNWKVPSTPSELYASSPSIDSLGDDLEEKFALLEEFINISFTPDECSIICPTEIVDLLFKKEIDLVSEKSDVRILKDDYLAMQVDGDGQQDMGSRVLSISAPLSAASIPIFFIATYFSDYVLVPVAAKSKVIQALETQNFAFSDISNSYISLQDSDKYRPQSASASASPHVGMDPSGLEEQTFSLFRRANVIPYLERSTKLLITGARTSSTSDSMESQALNLCVLKILLSPPKFFSLTIQSGSEISFLVDSVTSKLFPANTLLGSPTDFVIPISFDLSAFPEDSTGIVSGVASRLLENQGDSELHISYLSTAKSGIVLVSEDDLEIAFKALEG